MSRGHRDRVHRRAQERRSKGMTLNQKRVVRISTGEEGVGIEAGRVGIGRGELAIVIGRKPFEIVGSLREGLVWVSDALVMVCRQLNKHG